jgi:hypothetical protein
VSARSTWWVWFAALALVGFAAPASAQAPGWEPAPAPPASDGASAPVPSLAPPAVLTPAPPPPRRFVAAPEPDKPARVSLAKRWWFWAGLGAATVGVVLAAFFLGPRDPYNGNASPGTVSTF